MSSVESKLRQLESRGGSVSPEAPTDLTPRQLQILKLIAQGLTNKGVALVLQIVPHTVRDHVMRIHQRLCTHNPAQMIIRGVEKGLLNPAEFVEDYSLREYCSLTPREKEILDYFSHPDNPPTARDAARYFSLTRPTVKNHLENTYRKLGVDCRVQAVLVHLAANHQSGKQG